MTVQDIEMVGPEGAHKSRFQEFGRPVSKQSSRTIPVVASRQARLPAGDIQETEYPGKGRKLSTIGFWVGRTVRGSNGESGHSKHGELSSVFGPEADVA